MRKLLLLMCLGSVACSSTPSTGDDDGADGSPGGADAAPGAADARPGVDAPPGTFTLPPANAGFDYQISDGYPPAAGIQIVSRDRNDSPGAGLYNICYVNGFQIQPHEEDFWSTEHPDLMLRDGNGNLVYDSDWDEILIDIRTPAKRAEVASIVGDWIVGCAVDGFDAVEIDNLGSWERSGGLLTADDNVAMMGMFSAAAHLVGLAVAQKNSAELVPRRGELGTDFVVAEECNRYSECDVYTDAYGDQVLVVEYRSSDFSAGCSDFPELSIVLRDLSLSTPSDPDYQFDDC